ncbi:hypothetical protein BGZ60DRAFT_523894 [Tricladium varicosporioides]|nr:hypothetical protein BGZ60DRAFT_523894 [Hymenoscyphus varicosporioides]
MNPNYTFQPRSTRAPLTITTSSSITSTDNPVDRTSNQSAFSPRGQGALPPPYPSPQRTAGSPYPASSHSNSSTSPLMSSPWPRRATVPQPHPVPRSATFAGTRSPCSPFGKNETPRTTKAERRHSFEPNKVNVYTECGRHSDEWLFGGLSISGAFRKVVGRREEKDRMEERRGREE